MTKKNREGKVASAVGNKVRLARLKVKISQRELACLSGIDEVMISRLERGLHSPTIRTISSIAAGLGIEAGDLLP